MSDSITGLKGCGLRGSSWHGSGATSNEWKEQLALNIIGKVWSWAIGSVSKCICKFWDERFEFRWRSTIKLQWQRTKNHSTLSTQIWILFWLFRFCEQVCCVCWFWGSVKVCWRVNNCYINWWQWGLRLAQLCSVWEPGLGLGSTTSRLCLVLAMRHKMQRLRWERWVSSRCEREWL